MKKFALALCAAVVLTACGGSSTNVRPTIGKNYILGVEQVTHVGQPIVRVKDFGVPPVHAFASKTAFSASVQGGGKVDYPAGTEAIVLGTADNDGDYYYMLGLDPELPGGAHLLVDLGGEYDADALSSAGTMIEPCRTPGVLCITPKSIDFVPTKVDTTTAFSGNFELIYSGASKDTINLLYREYTPDDMARTSFAQNLTYDRESPLIRFRNLQIRVIEATNENMRYIVESDGLADDE